MSVDKEMYDIVKATIEDSIKECNAEIDLRKTRPEEYYPIDYDTDDIRYWRGRRQALIDTLRVMQTWMDEVKS